MDRNDLYEKIAKRKLSEKDYGPYIGDNGRVNKCVELFKSKQLKSGGVLLDIGGGTGDLCDAVKDLFDIRICADISEDNLLAARKKGNGSIIDWHVDVDKSGLPLHFLALSNEVYGSKKLSFAKNYSESCIDMITALDFIEHIVDPENFARECYRLLKPGGQVFINTPNIQFWRHIMTLIAGNFPHTSGDREVWQGGHLGFFTKSDLDKIFKTAGFTNCKQLLDEECFEYAPKNMLGGLIDKLDNSEQLMQFCCPNLLFTCEKQSSDIPSTDW